MYVSYDYNYTIFKYYFWYKEEIKHLILHLILEIVFENSIIIVTKTHQKNSIILSFFENKEEKEEFE